VGGGVGGGVDFGGFGGGPVEGGADVLADDVGFADPGTLGVRDDDGDGVAGCGEGLDEGEDVGGRLG
jgi:hypothetical protein